MKDKIKYKTVWRCDRCKDIVAEGPEKPKSMLITIKSRKAWCRTLGARRCINWKSKNVICLCARCRSRLQEILEPFGVDFTKNYSPVSAEENVEEDK